VATGGGSTTSALGPEAKTGNGTSAFSGVGTYSSVATTNSSLNATGTVTFSDYEAGVYSQGSYSLASVVYQSMALDSATAVMSKSTAMTGVGSMSMTSNGTGSSVGTLGISTWNGNGTTNYSSQDNYTATSTIQNSTTAQSSGTTSLYQAGNYGAGSYTFSSVALQIQGTTSITFSETGTVTANGSGTSTSTTTSGSAANAALAVAAKGSTDTTTSLYADSYSFSGLTTYSAIGQANSSSTNYYAGQYAAGSTSYASVSLVEHDDALLAATNNSVFTFGGASSLTNSGTVTGTGLVSYGVLNAGANDTLTFTASNSLTLNTVETTKYEMQATLSHDFSATGSMSFGALGLGALVHQSSATARDTFTYSSLGTTSGTGNGVSTLTTTGNSTGSFGFTGFTGSGTMTLASTTCFSVSGNSSTTFNGLSSSTSNDYEAGVFSNGTLALNSVAFQSGSTTQLDVWSRATSVFDTTGTYSRSGNGGGTDSQALANAGTDVKNGQGTYLFAGSARSITTATPQGETHGLQTTTLYGAGSYANGSLSLSSVLYRSGGSQTDTSHLGIVTTFSGTGVTTVSATTTATHPGTFGTVNTTGLGTTSEGGVHAASYLGTDLVSVDATGVTTNTNYSAGQYSNGSVSFSSVALNLGATVSSTAAETLTQLALQTLGAAGTLSAASTVTGSGYTVGGSNDNLVAGTMTYSGLQTTSTSAGMSGSLTYSELGSFGGQSYNFTTVTFRAGSNSSYAFGDWETENWGLVGSGTISGVTTVTSNGFTGTSRNSDIGTFNYSLTALSTITGGGSYSDSDYGAGSFTNGSISLSSLVHSERSNNSMTKTFGGLYQGSSTGTVVNDTQGISTRGVNGTFNYSSNLTTTFASLATAENSFSMNYEGKYGNGSTSLTSLALTGVVTLGFQFQQLGTYSATSTTGYSSYGMNSMSGGYLAVSRLHAEGSMTDGNLNLSCYLLQSGLVGNSALVRTDHSVAPGATSDSTYTWDAAETLSSYQEGQSANGSYSFASLALDYQTTTNGQYTESGSNSSFTAYNRSESDTYQFDFKNVGSGSVGTFTQNATETVGYSFSGTLSGGGTLVDGNSLSPAYTGTGTVGIDSGEMGQPDAGRLRPAGAQASSGDYYPDGLDLGAKDGPGGPPSGGQAPAGGGDKKVQQLLKVQGDVITSVPYTQPKPSGPPDGWVNPNGGQYDWQITGNLMEKPNVFANPDKTPWRFHWEYRELNPKQIAARDQQARAEKHRSEMQTLSESLNRVRVDPSAGTILLRKETDPGRWLTVVDVNGSGSQKSRLRVVSRPVENPGHEVMKRLAQQIFYQTYGPPPQEPLTYRIDVFRNMIGGGDNGSVQYWRLYEAFMKMAMKGVPPYLDFAVGGGSWAPHKPVGEISQWDDDERDADDSAQWAAFRRKLPIWGTSERLLDGLQAWDSDRSAAIGHLLDAGLSFADDIMNVMLAEAALSVAAKGVGLLRAGARGSSMLGATSRSMFGSIADGEAFANTAFRGRRLAGAQLVDLQIELERLYQSRGLTFDGIFAGQPQSQFFPVRNAAGELIGGRIDLVGSAFDQPLVRVLDETSHAIDVVEPWWPARQSRLLDLGRNPAYGADRLREFSHYQLFRRAARRYENGDAIMRLLMQNGDPDLLRRMATEIIR
jgi:hypothetical protein